MKKISGYFTGTITDNNSEPVDVKGFYTSFPEGADHVPDVIHVSYDQAGITGTVAFVKHINGSWHFGDILNQQFRERFSQFEEQILALAVKDFLEKSAKKHTHDLTITIDGATLPYEAQLIFIGSPVTIITGRDANKVTEALYSITTYSEQLSILMGSKVFNVSGINPPVYAPYLDSPLNPTFAKRQEIMDLIHRTLRSFDHKFS
jgi:hypothetical protein